MTLKSLSLPMLSAIVVLAVSPAAVLAANAGGTYAVAANQDCGWSNDNGHMVFHGTCPDNGGDDSNADTDSGTPSTV
jgi:hypothetical protein